MSNSINIQSRCNNHFCSALNHISNFTKSGIVLSAFLLFTATVAEATLLDTVSDAVNRIENKANAINTKTSTISTSVNNVKTTVSEVKDNVQNIPSLIQTKLGISLDPDIKERLLGGFQDMRTMIDEEKENLLAFGDGSPGTGCYTFKADILGIIGGLGDMTNALLSVAELSEIARDLSALEQLINTLPCFALLPASIALKPIPVSVLAYKLSTSTSALTTVRPLLVDNGFSVSPSSLTTNSLAVNKCDLIMASPNVFKAAATKLYVDGLAFKMGSAFFHPDKLESGKILIKKPQKGKTVIGIHGYASLTLEPPQTQKRIAAALGLISEVLTGVSEYTTRSIKHCEVVVAQQNILANQQKIMEGLCYASRGTSPACP